MIHQYSDFKLLTEFDRQSVLAEIFSGITLVTFIFFFLIQGSNATTVIELSEKYNELEDNLFDNAFGLPIHLESDAGHDYMQGVVYGIIYHPYKRVQSSLDNLKNWCDIMPQHLNIKACTYSKNGECQLTFYSGRKFFEKPEDTYQLQYKFKILSDDENHFHAELISEDGPLDSRDYLITVEANPLTNDSTFFRFGYQYKFGFWTRLAMSTYFNTLGRKKVGFTILEEDETGEPVYVKGIRGVIERNSLRYYFAISSFIDSLKIKEQDRFKYRINTWFDLTQKHQKQLFEMSKEDYLRYKNLEKQQQHKLQSEIHLNNNPAINTSESHCQ